MKKYNIISRETDIHTSVDKELSMKFQNIADSSINKYRLIGIQIAIKRPGGETWFGSSGTTDKERTILLSNDHLIRIGSLTKTFTAVVILRLYERGLIDLDDTIDKWFSDFPKGDKITVRMLLNHSSGIPEFLGPKIFIPSLFHPDRIWSPEELYDLIKRNKLIFEPGTDNSYANPNYILLGIIAEKISNQSLKDLFKHEILIPLNLSNTVFLPYDKAPGSLICGYDKNLIPLPGWYVNKPDNNSWSSCAYSSGGFASTAHDLLLFFDAILTRKIINENSYHLMTNVMSVENKKDKYLKHFGMGIFQYEDYYDHSCGHLGLFVGSEAVALFHQEKGYVFIFLSNFSYLKKKDEIIHQYLELIQ